MGEPERTTTEVISAHTQERFLSFPVSKISTRIRGRGGVTLEAVRLFVTCKSALNFLN